MKYSLQPACLITIIFLVAAGCGDKVTSPTPQSISLGGDIVYLTTVTASGQAIVLDASGQNPKPFNFWVEATGGGKMLYQGDIGAAQGIGIVNDDGTGQRIIFSSYDTSRFLLNGSATISSDGSHVAYEVYDTLGQPVDILWVAGSDGSNPIKISTIAFGDAAPVFSPDGQYVAYFAQDSKMKINITKIDGSTTRTLCTVSSGGGTIDWSGSKIAFEDNNTVYVINADGTNQVLISAGQEPVWSPDGKTLAYASGDPNWTKGDIIVTSNLGQTTTNLTNNSSSTVAGEPQWSPDGSKIIYMSGASPITSTAVTSVKVIDVSSKTSTVVVTPGQWPLYLR